MVKEDPHVRPESPPTQRPTPSVIREFRAALGLLEKLVSPPVGKNRELSAFLRQLMDVLGSLDDVPNDVVLRALEMLPRHTRPAAHRESVPGRSFVGIPLAEVGQMLSEEQTSKTELLRLVEERFEGSTGTLRRLRRDDLVKRIETLVQNERTHATLARLAAGEGGSTLLGVTHPRSTAETNAPPRRKGESDTGTPSKALAAARKHGTRNKKPLSVTYATRAQARYKFEADAKKWAMSVRAALGSGRGNVAMVEPDDRNYAAWAVQQGILSWGPGNEGVMLPGSYERGGGLFGRG